MKRKLWLLFALFLTLGIQAQSTITQVEYFLDRDLGIGENTILNIDSAEDIEATIVANIPSDIAVGYHKLFIRTKDNNGGWSHTERKNLEIAAHVVENSIVAGEYFLDDDPSHTSAISFSVANAEEDIEQGFMAQIPTNLPLGYHKLFGRIKDAQGHWSHTFRKNVQVVAPDENLMITAIEYFFNDDPTYGNANVVTAENADSDTAIRFNVAYPAGDYDFDDVLYVRAKDSNGKWSQTTILNAIDDDLGIALIDKNTITLYPNPVRDLLHLETSEQYIIQSFKIFDLNGREVLKSTSG